MKHVVLFCKTTIGVIHCQCTQSIERDPFSAKNQTLRYYRVYISPMK